MHLDYFYDHQIRRYLIEFAAIFQGFQWMNGRGDLRTVPVKLGTADRQVMHILNNNSENTIISCPSISVWITDIAMSHDRRQAPNYVDHRTILEREWDEENQQYTENPGIRTTVERLMPVPYMMTCQVDIWTSNQEQKWQLLEQIMTIFNPGLDIQTSTNPVDWTALTTVTMENITYSSRSVPVGTDSEIDVSSMTFSIPILINPPSKVKRVNIIEQINLNLGSTILVPKICEGEGIYFDDFVNRVIVTPGNHRIQVLGDTITLLGANGLPYDDNGNHHSWDTLLKRYGTIRPAISQLRLKTNPNMDDHASDIVGTFEINQSNTNELFWTIDSSTLKTNTLRAVNAVIDPLTTMPYGHGISVAEGVRYLLLDNIGPGPTMAWGGISAKANDIIEYHNGSWVVSFSAEAHRTPEYCLNMYTGKQLRWTGEEWILAIDGEYHTGFWRLFL